MNLDILLVYEDDSYAEELMYSFEVESYHIMRVKTISSALEKLKEKDYNLAIIDMEYSDGTGLDLKKEMNEIKDVPTIVVTKVSDDIQKVLALEYGADDYIVRPFNILELKARIRAVLRRISTNVEEENQDPNNIVIADDFEFNFLGRKVKRKGEEIELTGKEFDFLYFLTTHPGQVFTREELANEIWDENYEGHLRTVDVHIRRLREKIDVNEKDSYIQTKWGEGYYFGKEEKAPEEDE